MTRATLLGTLLLAVALVGGTRTAEAKDAGIDAAVRILRDKAKEPFDQLDRQKAIRALGRIGGADAAEALLPLFDDPFVHLRDHVVSAWIGMLGGARAAETRAWLARQAGKHESAEVRRGAVVALGIAGGDAATPLLTTLVEKRLRTEKDARVLTALAASLIRARAPFEEGLARLLRHTNGAVVLAAVDALREDDDIAKRATEILAAVPAARTHPELGDAARVLLGLRRGDPDAVSLALDAKAIEPRIALAEAVGAGHGKLDEALPRLLADASWRVRAAAIHAAERRRDLEAVPHLAGRLMVEEGRLRLDLVRALRALTGAEIDDDASLWHAWWEAHRERAQAAGPTRTGPAPIPGEATRAAFFRLPIRSKRIAFLLDASGSMRDPADPSKPDGPTKWARARQQVADTLRALDDDVQFDVFVYRYPSSFPPNARMERALRRFKTARPRNVKKAIRWLDKQEAKGWGAFSDAFSALLGEEIDTIYFLSDGRPSRGRYDRDFRLLQELEPWNRFRRVVIHTVLAGRGKDDRRFLEDLAAQTGGMFRDAAGSAE